MPLRSATPHLVQLLVPLQYMEAHWRDGVSLNDAVTRVFAGLDGAEQPAEAARVFERYLDQLRAMLDPALLLQLVSEDFAVEWLGLDLQEAEQAAAAAEAAAAEAEAAAEEEEEEEAEEERRSAPDWVLRAAFGLPREPATVLPPVAHIPVMPDVERRGDDSPGSDAEQ